MPETVSILSVRRIPRPVAPGVVKDQVAVTYAAAGLTPRIVYLEPENDTDEERKRLIAADIREARGQTTSTLDLP